MTDILTEQQIIRLHQEMVAPLAMHDIVAGRDTLDDTARYTLDVTIAEFQPDTALICIALCAAHIANRHADRLPIAAGLGMEAGRIVNEYAPLWLAHADRRLTTADEGRVIDLLEQMPEDFESMADLLDAVRANLPEDSDAAGLCEILSQNTHSFIAYLDDQAERDRTAERETLLDRLEVNDNVITFPLSARMH